MIGKLFQRFGIAGMAAPDNYSGKANTDEFISLKGGKHVTFIIRTGAWAAGTAAVTLQQAPVVAGTDAKALAFSQFFSDEVTDGIYAEIAATNPGLANATFNLDTANKTYIVEVDASELDVNGNFDCINIHVATPGANADYYSIIAITSDIRYSGNPNENLLVD